MAVEFGLLGDLRVRWGEHTIDVGHARQQCVLAVLLIEANRLVSVDQLVDRVWSGRRLPSRPPNAVQTYIALLRRALAPLENVGIVRRSGGYRLDVAEETVDIHRFRCLINQARDIDDKRAASVLEQALALWQGEPFAMFDTGWFNTIRTTLHRQRHAAQLDLVDIQLRHGRHAALLVELAERAERHLLDERAAGQYILALYRCGRQADALAHYESLRRRLADELGTDPGPTLRQLHLRILTADPTLGTPAAMPMETAATAVPDPAPQPRATALPKPQELPTDTAYFTGRGADIAKLDALLAARSGDPQAAVAITAIDGPAGVGKTTLAVHWALRVRHRFPDGQLYVNLRGFDPTNAPPEPAEVLEGLLRTLNVAANQIPTGLEPRARLYRSLLAGRKMLVLLDNAATAEQVRPLLPGSPGCLVMVTSRSRLAGLAAREGVHRVTLDTLSESDSLDLLRKIIGPARVDAEPDFAAELVRQCGYLPLALRIAADRIAVHADTTLASLVEELADVQQRLDTLTADGDETTAVRAVFSWSYRAIPPDAARAFRLLGLHGGPDVGIPAAAALLGVAPGQARLLLDNLAAVHLIEPTARHRYRFHDLLRTYAVEQVMAHESHEARRTAVRQVLDWYLHTADAAVRAFAPPRARVQLKPPGVHCVPLVFGGRDDALAWCDAELPNLVAAVHLAARHDEMIVAWKLPVILWDFFVVRKHWADWITTHHVGLAAAKRMRDPEGEAWILNMLGPAYRELKRFEDALDCFQQALELWQEIGDREGRGWTLYNLGDTCREIGRLDDAVGYFQRSLALSREAGERWGEGWVLNMLGDTCRQLGRLTEAVEYLRQSLPIRREIGDRVGEGWTLNMLGDTCRQLGRWDEAIDFYRQSLHNSREIGLPKLEGHNLLSLGDTLRDIGRLDAAHESWRSALAVFEGISDPRVVEASARIAG